MSGKKNYYRMFKSLRILSTAMAACIVSPNVACVYSKQSSMQLLPKTFPRSNKQTREMQTLIPHEVIQVVSHWSFLPHLEYPRRYWGTCNTNSAKMSKEPNFFQVTSRKQRSTYTKKWSYFVGHRLINNEQELFWK